MLSEFKLRGTWRKIRAKIGIRSEKMAIHSHVPWYVKFGGYGIAMGVAAAVAWFVVDNRYRITGFNREETVQQIASLTADKQKLQQLFDVAKSQLNDNQSLLKIERSSQAELSKNMTQLQDENASLKEDLGFLRNIMSAGSVPEGISIANLKVEADALPNEYRYRLLLTQGGQRKQDFKGKVQVIARIQQSTVQTTLSFPPDSELKESKESKAVEQKNQIEFRYYQKIDGRFKIPEGAQLKSVQIRVLGLPGLEVRSQRSINL